MRLGPPYNSFVSLARTFVVCSYQNLAHDPIPNQIGTLSTILRLSLPALSPSHGLLVTWRRLRRGLILSRLSVLVSSAIVVIRSSGVPILWWWLVLLIHLVVAAVTLLLVVVVSSIILRIRRLAAARNPAGALERLPARLAASTSGDATVLSSANRYLKKQPGWWRRLTRRSVR